MRSTGYAPMNKPEDISAEDLDALWQQHPDSAHGRPTQWLELVEGEWQPVQQHKDEPPRIK